MLYNLLNHPKKLTRDVSIRLKNKEINSAIAKKFDKEYFDGTREQGYGGYIYDGRWKVVAKEIIKRYQLKTGSHFLDVGCAKGFLIYDLKKIFPKLNVHGLDISEYAKSKSFEEIKQNIHIGNSNGLDFPDNFFDASVSINTIHNHDYENCLKSIKELIRVTKNKKNIFIQVDAYNNDEEKQLFETWMLTAKTYLKPTEWLDMFKKANYEGDYFWTTIGFNKN